jgi:hypothetical protein
VSVTFTVKHFHCGGMESGAVFLCPLAGTVVIGELLHPPPLESLGYRQGHSTPRVHSRPGLEKGGLVGRNSQMGITKGGAQGRTWEELLVSGRVKSDGVPKSGRKGK